MSQSDFANSTDHLVLQDTLINANALSNNAGFRLPVSEAVVEALREGGLFNGRFAEPSTTAPVDTSLIWQDKNSNPSVYRYFDSGTMTWEIATFTDIWQAAAGAVNIAAVETAFGVNLTSSAGTGDTIALATGSNAGVMDPLDKQKLDGIETNATRDQSDAEIKTAYENNADTNAFTDAEQTKLAGVEAGATADQSDAEIKVAYENNANTNAFTDAEQTKLASVESGAEVNVQADWNETDTGSDAYIQNKPGGGGSGFTNLSNTPTATNVTIESDSGSDTTVAAATGSLAGVMSAADKTTIDGLGTMSTQAENAVAITGGSITGITDLALADGGSGASTASGARTNFGLVIGTDVQAHNADLAAIAGLSTADGNFIVGNGATWVAESGATVRTSMGLGSLATLSTINNGNWSGTDLSVSNGGTGASSLADGNVLLGSGTGAITALDVTAKGSILVGDGTTDPQALGVGTNDHVLTADSAQGTGLKWAEVSGGTTLGSVVTTTSGTSADFTGIPSGTRLIIVNLEGVSMDGNTDIQIQLGDSGGIETTGYVGVGSSDQTPQAYTTGFGFRNGDPTVVYDGSIVLTLLDSTTNTWCVSGNIASGTPQMLNIAGSKSLSAELDRLRLTTVNGTANFDAGKANILYI